MIIYLFDRKTYEQGLDTDNVFNIYKWNKEMCENEFKRSEDGIMPVGEVIRLDMSDEDSRSAFEEDYNDKEIHCLKYIIRIFE